MPVRVSIVQDKTTLPICTRNQFVEIVSNEKTSKGYLSRENWSLNIDKL